MGDFFLSPMLMSVPFFQDTRFSSALIGSHGVARTQSGQSSAIRALPCGRLVLLPVFSVLKRGAFPFYRPVLLKIPGFQDIGTSFALPGSRRLLGPGSQVGQEGMSQGASIGSVLG